MIAVFILSCMYARQYGYNALKLTLIFEHSGYQLTHMDVNYSYKT